MAKCFVSHSNINIQVHKKMLARFLNRKSAQGKGTDEPGNHPGRQILRGGKLAYFCFLHSTNR